jgi:hypothetical protein
MVACDSPPFPELQADDGEVPPPGECAPSGWSCLDIGECAEGCGVNLDCVEACKVRGCDEAMAVFDELSDCGIDKCWTSCLGGSTTETCHNCNNDKCGAETTTCEETLCPEICSEPAEQTREDSQVNCLDIIECTAECDWGLSDECTAECTTDVCEDASTAWAALRECSTNNCLFECATPLKPFCVGCQMDRCADLLTACEGQEC